MRVKKTERVRHIDNTHSNLALLLDKLIAKSLHFSNVTIVGIINSDIAIHLTNFSARKRTSKQ